MHEPETKRWLTSPNVVTLIRIIGSPGLMALAWFDQTLWLAVLAVLLVFTEWLDGFLARRLHVSSAVGARLDTIADAVFYWSLLIALVMLRPKLIAAEGVWIAAAIGSYAISWLASLVKFRRLPSYHTWAAKAVWVLVGIGAVCLLAEISPWPFRVAMACVTLANIEAICITQILKECRVDVRSIWHAKCSNHN